MQSERSAILIRCTYEEAELIRRAAKQEHRTLSGFALNVMLKHIASRNIEGTRPGSPIKEIQPKSA